jgi:hypothetical protein
VENSVRFPHLNFDYFASWYASQATDAAEFQAGSQRSWSFRAHNLEALAKLAYALGHPLEESRIWLRQATSAYKELFSLRGTSFSTCTIYKKGKPVREEQVADDGYTSVDSFAAAMAALSVQDFSLCRELVKLAGHSPGGKSVSLRSDVCNSNEQTISHALNALLAGDAALASLEAAKLAMRRGTNMEKQLAATIAALAAGGGVLSELETLLFHHEKLARREENATTFVYFLCMPALGLSALAVHLEQIDQTDLPSDNVYCPRELLFPTEPVADCN